MTRTRIVILAVLVMMPLLSGCFMSREMSQLKRDVERQHPNLELKRNFVLNVGSGTIHMAESVVGLIDREETRLAGAYLHDMDRIRVGIYDVRWNGDARRRTIDLDRILRLNQRRWEKAIVVRDTDLSAQLYYRSHRGTVRGLYLIAFHDNQLVAVRVQGNMQRILRRFLEENRPLTELPLFTMTGIDLQ